MSTSLGIGFSGRRIYFTELMGDRSAPKVNHVHFVDMDFNFEDELGKYKSSQKDLTNISAEIRTYVGTRNLNIEKAALTISAAQAFLIILPIDHSEGEQSINSKIYWELSNYFPDSYSDYVINTYRLNNVLPCKDSDEYLIIAVPKNTLEFVKRIFKLCSLELSMVDIDHFSAENSLRSNFGEKLEGKNILLAGLKDGRVDYGYISNKKYKFYAHSRCYSESEFNLALTRKLAGLIAAEPISKKVDVIYLYGDEIKEDTLEALRKMDKGHVEILNPFENISATDLFLKNESLRKISYRYSASCGAALRNML